MLKNKILIKITGSIAAYKVAYLISKLIQNGFEVKTVVTQSALKFIGTATLEGLTSNEVYTDSFEEGKMMSHINLTKWADLTILVPADANTINKYANGIADNLVTSLFLAHDNKKPYLVAPAMNTNMYEHPATQESLQKLSNWGIKILPTEEGILACGDFGKGKLLDPDKIYYHILRNLSKQKVSKKILITSGGTKENIDNVRYITNLSTGKTGSTIAEKLYLLGHDVTLLKSEDSISPSVDLESITFTSYKSLANNLEELLTNFHFDAIIHLAAISDYSPNYVEVGSETYNLPADLKISSINEKIKVSFSRNEKLINKIKNWSPNKSIQLIGFKLVNDSETKNGELLSNMFKNSNSDYIVFNSLDNRNGSTQKGFELLSKTKSVAKVESAQDLTKELDKIISEAK